MLNICSNEFILFEEISDNDNCRIFGEWDDHDANLYILYTQRRADRQTQRCMSATEENTRLGCSPSGQFFTQENSSWFAPWSHCTCSTSCSQHTRLPAGPRIEAPLSRQRQLPRRLWYRRAHHNSDEQIHAATSWHKKWRANIAYDRLTPAVTGRDRLWRVGRNSVQAKKQQVFFACIGS